MELGSWEMKSIESDEKVLFDGLIVIMIQSIPETRPFKTTTMYPIPAHIAQLLMYDEVVPSFTVLYRAVV